MNPKPSGVPPTTTREPQYDRCLEVQNEIGLTPLGLMTNQVWHDDPRRLAFVLARYKFVSKMLAGYARVAEVGCADAFGTRIVCQEVGSVTAYDFDPVFVGDAQQRASKAWPIDVRLHDIVHAPLAEQYDAVYCLDVLEHIEPSSEHACLDHLRASLTDKGVLIVGTPSLESQSYASPPSKAGHVNCKSGDELRRLLREYLDHVFMFSMNDEVLHTGFMPMAHYLLALCTGPRARG